MRLVTMAEHVSQQKEQAMRLREEAVVIFVFCRLLVSTGFMVV